MSRISVRSFFMPGEKEGKGTTDCTLSLWERGHFVHDDLEEFFVGQVRDREVLACALLQFGIEQARRLVKHGDELFANLGEQVEPLEVGRQEESLRCVRHDVRTRMKEVELLDRGPALEETRSDP